LTVGDINIDPLFATHREAALRAGLQMACFRPILSAKKQVCGALALSYPQQHRRPEPDSEMMERAIHLVAIATECHRNDQELREVSRRLSQSQDDERRRTTTVPLESASRAPRLEILVPPDRTGVARRR